MLRKPASKRREIPVFLDTPAGIITASGVRFATTCELLEAWAGPVLENVPLEVLIRRTEVWLRSAQTLALWAMAVLLLLVPPLWAGGLAIALYLVWEMLAPSLANGPLSAVLRVAERPLVQAALYVAVLSVLGIAGEVGAVGVGLGGFIAFRWQLIPFLARPLVRRAHARLFSLPAPDQVLRALVLLAAVRHGISLPEVEALRGRWPWRPQKR